MTIWGFYRKRTAQTLASVGRQQPPRQTVDPAHYVQGRSWLITTPSGGIPARSGAVPGKATCTGFYIDPADTVQGYLKLGGPDSLTFDVYNVSTDIAPENELLVAIQIGGRPVVILPGEGGTSGGGRPWMRFLTTTTMTDRQITGTVLEIFEPPNNEAVDDSILLADPQNLFPDTETQALGFAYWNADQFRWEIEDVSQPINEVRIQFSECLLKPTLKFNATIDTNTQADWNLADNTNTDIPPEWTESPTGVYTITDVENRYQLDTVAGEYGTLRRVTDRKEHDPTNQTVSKPGSAANVKWELVAVTDHIARYVCATKTGSQFTVTDSWDGADPTTCDPPLNLTFSEGCLNIDCLADGETMVCSLDPETVGAGSDITYRILSTNSAVLGSPVFKNVVTSSNWDLVDECGTLSNNLEPVLTFNCPSQQPPNPPPQKTNPLPTVTQRVQTGTFAGGNGLLCFTFEDIQTIACSGSGGGGTVDCESICDIICECPQFYSLPEVCTTDPEPFCCCGDVCFFSSVVLTVNFLGGPTITTTSSVSSGSDCCSWDLTMSDGSTYNVTYNVGGQSWTVAKQADGNPSTPGFTGTGDAAAACQGATVRSGEHSATVSPVGEQCKPCIGCPDCGTTDNQRVALGSLQWVGATGNPPDDWREGYDPIETDWTDTGSCSWEVEIEWTSSNLTTGETRKTTGMAQIDYDGSAGKWNITAGESPVLGMSGDWSLTAPCPAGGSCDKNDCDSADMNTETAIISGRIEECTNAQAASVGAMALPATPPAREFITLEGEVVKDTRGLGDVFKATHPELFQSCGCSKDVIPVLNRAGASVDIATVKRLAQMLARKNRGRSQAEIMILITQAAADYED